MKNTILLAALLVVSSSALANPGSYVGVNVGSTELKITADGDSGSENGTGGKVYAGYQFTPAIGAELGYVRFGDISATEDGFTVGFKPNSFYAALTGHHGHDAESKLVRQNWCRSHRFQRIC